MCSSRRMAHYPKGTKLFWNGCSDSCCQRKCFAEKPGYSYAFTIYSRSKNRRRQICQRIRSPPQHICTVGVPRQRICEKGFKYDPSDRSCRDVNECEINNGGCGVDFCENFIGGKLCYSEFSDEKQFCQHDYRLDPDTEDGYECECFPGYTLNDDGFGCTKSSNNELENLMKDDETDCRETSMIPLDGKCFTVGREKMTYGDTRNYCHMNGGKLVNIDSRMTWWKVGHLVKNSKFGIDHGKSGMEPFYAVVSHDLGMVVIGNGQATVVNFARDMDKMPPQLNQMNGGEKFYSVCEFEAVFL